MAGKASVTAILDDLDETADGGDEATVGDLRERAGHRGSGAFLVVPALLGVSPVAAIPGVPTLVAAMTFLLAAQIAFGKPSPWLPGFVERRKIDGDKLTNGTDKLRPVARWLDRWFHGRLAILTGPTATRAAAVAAAGLCLLVPPLELLPMAAVLPFGAIALFGLAMILHDGLLMLAGFALAAGAFWAGIMAV